MMTDLICQWSEAQSQLEFKPVSVLFLPFSESVLWSLENLWLLNSYVGCSYSFKGGLWPLKEHQVE